jgi:adhesin/invasin
VEVLDVAGRPVVDGAVVFRVTSGGGRMAAGAVRTNSEGLAQDRWTLGTDVSVPQRVEVHAVDSATGTARLLTSFTATATAGPATDASASSDSRYQTVEVGTAAPVVPTVYVSDENGNPVAGVPVTFHVAPGNGTIDGATGVSDTAGKVTVGRWTIGTSTATQYQLRASGPGLDTAVFVAQPTEGPATRLVVASGDDQSGRPGRRLAEQVTFMVVDQYGNRVHAGAKYDNHRVTFSGDGSQDAASWGSGAYRIDWRLSSTVGANAMTISLPEYPAITPATAHATGAPGPVARVTPTSSTGWQSVEVGTAAPVAPTAFVSDDDGNPVAGVSVTFQAAPGNGTAEGVTAVTDADGLASVGRWTIDTTTASQDTLTATVAGLSPAVFLAQPQPGPAAKLVVASGDEQSATAGHLLAERVVFMVTDRYGNRVYPGSKYDQYRVTFTGGGSQDGASWGTGIYRIGWRLGTTAGANAMTISLPEYPAIAPATARATGTAP